MFGYYWLALLVSIAGFGFFAFGITRPKTDVSQWHEYHGGWQIPVIDGRRARGPVMRRKVKGAWEYRYMTADELSDFESSWAW
ncbi:hypothetical protein [Allomesorhizobium camelthorni]|uniref:Uncharacterized protein n=1 Tax=Allomesorhizobium camelthorni TaxID=475069 RepID=A0A6G4W849_9HYPH|nr:hypothetical protein [Mesorhizobium camelthorni]NGO50416.1 hypothetical protein [Mesorhizobium camelthorni]